MFEFKYWFLYISDYERNIEKEKLEFGCGRSGKVKEGSKGIRKKKGENSLL